MRRTLTTLAVAGLLTGALAAPAAAGPLPSVPEDCRELQALIGMENVRDCRDDEEHS